MNNNKITFILHKPQLSENIGACARAIKNFNFQNLYMIDPKPIFPNDKILATSVGAKDVINKSKVFTNLENSLGDIDILIATSARFRNKNVKHINLEDLKKIDFRKKIGFLFGSEASGLSNKEISYANYTLQIPTNINFKSLNLSHSVIIIAQFISSFLNSKSNHFKKSKKVNKIYCIPGNAGTSKIAENVNINLNNFDEIKDFVNSISQNISAALCCSA